MHRVRARRRSSRARRACRRTSGTCRSRRGSRTRTARSRPAGSDQWSGKTLRSAPRATAAMPVRLSSQPTMRSSSVGRVVAAVARPSWPRGVARRPSAIGHVPEARPDRLREVAQRHERAVRRPAGSAAAAAARAAGPKVGVAPSRTSNVDWWHGQISLCSAARYSPTGQPAWVHSFEYATQPCGRPGHAIGRQLEQPVRDADQQRLAVRRADGALREHGEHAVDRQVVDAGPAGRRARPRGCPPSRRSRTACGPARARATAPGWPARRRARRTRRRGVRMRNVRRVMDAVSSSNPASRVGRGWPAE